MDDENKLHLKNFRKLKKEIIADIKKGDIEEYKIKRLKQFKSHMNIRYDDNENILHKASNNLDELISPNFLEEDEMKELLKLKKSDIENIKSALNLYERALKIIIKKN